MKARYVVDTNVLIAASAADPAHPTDIDATPEDPALRLRVWEWLEQFRSSDARLVLDTDNKIFDEYSKKLGFNDFGIQVVMHKMNTATTDDVTVQYDHDGHGVLPVSLVSVIHDLADRKMVAAALGAAQTVGVAPIAFAGDTDWHGWEDQLLRHGVVLEPLIEQWSRAKFTEKKLR